jgi:hypothetical protein
MYNMKLRMGRRRRSAANRSRRTRQKSARRSRRVHRRTRRFRGGEGSLTLGVDGWAIDQFLPEIDSLYFTLEGAPNFKRQLVVDHRNGEYVFSLFNENNFECDEQPFSELKSVLENQGYTIDKSTFNNAIDPIKEFYDKYVDGVRTYNFQDVNEKDRTLKRVATFEDKLTEFFAYMNKSTA